MSPNGYSRLYPLWLASHTYLHRRRLRSWTKPSASPTRRLVYDHSIQADVRFDGDLDRIRPSDRFAMSSDQRKAG